MKISTKAFRDNPTNSRESTGCLLDIKDDCKNFKAVFVRRASGVRTFYPDATPDAGRNGTCAIAEIE
ncbi:MAG: EndoU domain-containing protein [Cyanothece sp. SIO1E1]|nr:EndoU domain-containing protein [Cyanothece sp. SIO1E1]